MGRKVPSRLDSFMLKVVRSCKLGFGSFLGLQPRGSIFATIMELGPKNHNGDGFLGLDSIVVMYMDPLGK